MQQDVESGEVGRAKGRALRATEERARERVYFVDREVGLHHPRHRGHHAVHAEPVRDEAGHVLRDDDALAEHHFAETARCVERVRRGVRRGNELEQVHVPRRIEKMHAEEMLLEGSTTAFDEHVHRNARRVRRDDRVWFS